MPIPANSLNLSGTAGVVSFDGTASVSTSSVTKYDVLVGGASQTIANVAPSATSGVPLISQGAASNPTFGTAVVAGGGTGVVTMTTAYAPVCAGTTATGALQVASTGLSTPGWVLTSTGAGSLPTFQAAPGSTGITTVAIQTFVYTGAGQTYTPTTNMKYCVIQCLGGGGGGGGATLTGAAQVSGGGGGGAGEYAVGIFSAATIGASKSVTIGAAGSANSGATGGTGGTTSVGSTIISAIGGVGGTTSAAAGICNLSGALGGTGGTGGSYRAPGNPGSNGTINFTPSITYVGNGGGSFCGAGGLGAGGGASAAGGNGLGYGAGGGGAYNYQSVAAKAGGAGAPGIVIITEYI